MRSAFVIGLAITSLPCVARADEDTTAGRLDGDVTFGGGLGATFGPRAPRATIDVRARYLSTAGLFVTYEDKLAGDSAEPERVLAFGFELRPLFLGRWLLGKELGAGRVDMLIDSFGLELGGFAQKPVGEQFGTRPGLQAGIGLEIPIFSRATGLFVQTHGGCRWSDAALGGDNIAGPADRALYLGVTLAWHQVVALHVVDRGDEAPE